MTFSWKELVFHGLLSNVKEPSLVKELMKIVMKGRRDYLDKEARVFQSGLLEWGALKASINYIRVVDSIRIKWIPETIVPVSELDKVREDGVLSYQIYHHKVMDEFLSTWRERIPEQRRRAVMMNKESMLLRWRGHSDYDITSGRARDLDFDYHSIENSIKWYGDIHEGRYYLFWDKTLSSPIEDCATRRRQSKAFLMSGFDINIIDGEGLYKNISDTWVYAYEQWTKNPGGWGERQFEFTMVHSIGKKEKKHIEDMFH